MDTLKINRKMFYDVAALVERYPEKFDMDMWSNGEITPQTLDVNGRVVEVNCGTTACVAGWVVNLSNAPITCTKNGFADTYNYNEVASEILGLDSNEAVILFHSYQVTPAALRAVGDGTKPSELEHVIAHSNWVDANGEDHHELNAIICAEGENPEQIWAETYEDKTGEPAPYIKHITHP